MTNFPHLQVNSINKRHIPHTWNHSPLGSAGLVQEAKKMPTAANIGQAINMSIPVTKSYNIESAYNQSKIS